MWNRDMGFVLHEGPPSQVLVAPMLPPDRGQTFRGLRPSHDPESEPRPQGRQSVGRTQGAAMLGGFCFVIFFFSKQQLKDHSVQHPYTFKDEVTGVVERKGLNQNFIHLLFFCLLGAHVYWHLVYASTVKYS